MIRINLLPGATRKRPSGLKLDVGAALAGLTGKFDRFALGAGVAVAAAVASVAVMFVTQHTQAQDLGERERKALQDSTRFAAVLRDRAQAEASRDAVLRQLALIQSIDDRRYMWPHILEEVSAALPPFTWLTQIVQTSAPPNAAVADSVGRAAGADTTSPAGRARMQEARRNAAMAAARRPMKFRITGHTVDIQALTRFMRDLEQSPFIQNVTLGRSDLVMVEQKEVTEFQLDAESEPADSTVITVEPLSVEIR